MNKIRLQLATTLVKYQGAIALLAVAVTLSVYFYNVFHFALNIPVSDDFEAVLELLTNFDTATTSEKLTLLFRNHMEHRIVYCRLIALLDYAIFGQVNFARLIIWGNMSLIGLLWLFYKMTPSVENKALYFVPVPFLFLNFQQYENAVWAMGSLQNLWVIFFSLLSLYLLSRESKSAFTGAIFSAVAASFTSGSGLFVWIAGVCFLLLSKRKLLTTAVWTLAGILIFYAYFFNYTPPDPKFSATEAVLLSPDKVISDFFAIAGSGLTFEKIYETNSPGAIWFLAVIIFGYLVTVLFLYLIFKKYSFENPLFFSAFILFLIIFLSLAVSRISFGAEYIAEVGRYKINSLAFYIVLYFILLDTNFKQLKVVGFLAIVMISIVYWQRSYSKNLHTVISSHSLLLGSSFKRYTENSFAGLVHWEPAGLAARILIAAEAKGVYKMPDLSKIFQPPNEEINEIVLPAESDDIVCAFDVTFNETKNSYMIDQGWAIVKGRTSRGNRIFVVLKSREEIRTFESPITNRHDVTIFFQSRPGESEDYDESGFNFQILAEDLKSGEYDVGVLIRTSSGEEFVHFPDKQIVKK